MSLVPWVLLSLVGIIFVIVFLILLLIVICLRQRIQIAIELIKEASRYIWSVHPSVACVHASLYCCCLLIDRAISNMWFTLLFPIVTFILLVAVIVWYIAVALYPPTSVFLVVSNSLVHSTYHPVRIYAHETGT